MRSAHLLAFAALSAATGISHADIRSVNWTTPATGVLGSASVTMTGVTCPWATCIWTTHLTSPDYAAGPLAGVTAIQFSASDNWTATFDRELPELLLYVDAWRGAYFEPGANPPTHYEFSMPFTILSGLNGSSLSGNTLSLPYDGENDPRFYYGILRFAGPISSLSVESDGAYAYGQLLTFAAPVPEPATAASIAAVVLGLAVFGRKRLR